MRTGFLARNPEFLRKALEIFHRSINRHHENKARIHKLKDPKTGAITVFQRFGGALNLNVHFHTIFIAGFYYKNDYGGEAFFEILPSQEEVIQLNGIWKKRLTGLLVKFEHEDHDDNQNFSFHANVKILAIIGPSWRGFVGTFYEGPLQKRGLPLKELEK
jgi:hypothetical protein